jgi:hypothetical protein
MPRTRVVVRVRRRRAPRVGRRVRCLLRRRSGLLRHQPHRLCARVEVSLLLLLPSVARALALRLQRALLRVTLLLLLLQHAVAHLEQPRGLVADGAEPLAVLAPKVLQLAQHAHQRRVLGDDAQEQRL